MDSRMQRIEVVVLVSVAVVVGLAYLISLARGL
jgi:hypothetical protein